MLARKGTIMPGFTVYHPVKCEKCGRDLTAPNQITVHFSAAGHEFDVLSCVLLNGCLIDIEDLIRNGYHAGSNCICGEPLEELDP